jgi:hypothetical protein
MRRHAVRRARELTKNRVLPVLTRMDSGTVLVHMRVDAPNDMAARAAVICMTRAERLADSR